MPSKLTVGVVVRFMHHWAQEDAKRRPGLVVHMNVDARLVVVCPGLTRKPRWSEPIEFPRDFGGAPTGNRGIGLDHTTHLDLGDMAKLSFERVEVIGKIPVPLPVLERVKTRIFEYKQLGSIGPPVRRG